MSRSGHATRQRSRQLALQALYAGDLAERDDEERVPIEETFERVAENFDLPQGARGFASELAFGTIAHRAEIDALLAENATNWKLSRMAAVDRNILRLAVYELTGSLWASIATKHDSRLSMRPEARNCSSIPVSAAGVRS